MCLPSLRHWRHWRTVAAYQPITNLTYNAAKWRGQQRWMYRHIGRALSHDPLYIRSLLDNQNRAPMIPPARLDRVLSVVPVLVYAVGLYFFANLINRYVLSLFFVVIVPAMSMNYASGFISGAVYSVKEELDANRFDLLVLTPMGAHGVLAALSGVMFRRVQPHPFVMKTWLGRVVMIVLVWVPIFLVAYLAWDDLTRELRLVALYHGLLNVPTLALFGAGILLGYVQAIVLAHWMTMIAWWHTTNALLVRVAAIGGAWAAIAVVYGVSLWLALLVVSQTGAPLMTMLFTGNGGSVPMRTIYLFSALLMALYIATTEGLVWCLARWQRQLVGNHVSCT